MVEFKARMETAQHILHHILVHEYYARQTGMQVYGDRIRMDVRCAADLTKIRSGDLEEAVNAVIRRNLPVTVATYPRDGLPAGIDAGGVPARFKDIRVVSIGDYDVQPCGNPHVSNTGEIGVYRILKVERSGQGRLQH